MFFKKFVESAFEIALRAFSAVGHLGKVAKDLKVTVRINNLVETKDPLRKLSLLAESTWLDLLDDKKRCQLDGFPINTVPDILLTIKTVERGLSISVESEYLEKSEPKTEIGEAFREFIDDANEIIDEAFGRDRSLLIETEVASFAKTKQVLRLNEFFEVRISRMFFAVLVKKFVAEVSK
ncbi:MAG: hypothetical protein WAZ12_01420 [Candidatus Absconditicoccaceae bacterium]